MNRDLSPTPSDRPADGQDGTNAGRHDPNSQPPPVVSSAEILRGGRVAIIRHGNEEYRLIETRHGRLLLQK